MASLDPSVALAQRRKDFEDAMIALELSEPAKLAGEGPHGERTRDLRSVPRGLTGAAVMAGACCSRCRGPFDGLGGYRLAYQLGPHLVCLSCAARAHATAQKPGRKVKR